MRSTRSTRGCVGLAAGVRRPVRRRRATCILPGYTHLQRAQPVLAAALLAGLLRKARARSAAGWPIAAGGRTCCRLGAAALAGTSLPIDRDDVAQRLGFDDVAANSLDVSSDRDFVLEFAFVLGADRRASEHLGRGVDPVVDDRVRLPQAAAGVLHRLVDHAAEDQPRRAGADPRQDGPRDRQPARRCWCWSRGCRWPTTATCRKTSSRCSIRSTRSSVPGAGRAAGGRGRAEPRRRSPRGSIAGIWTPRR